MGRLFGTDGVRGVANTELTVELAVNIGRAAAMVVEEARGKKPLFLVGRDTRLSGEMLEAALCAGLTSAGANVLLVGIVPTPAVAYLVTKYGADGGVMISASHNPYEYNGIKIFSHQGFKLLDAQDEEMESIILDKTIPYTVKFGKALGKLEYCQTAAADYVAHLVSTVAGSDLSGLRVAVDCANGSASRTAKDLFQAIGANADVFECASTGVNINLECGSTHMQRLQKRVLEGGYDVGFAFDGDADRCLAVDEKGCIVDGDKMMAIFAQENLTNSEGSINAFVATVMSNFGLFAFCQEAGICCHKAKVGDRYVLEMMLEKNIPLGGEQSGHIIFLDYATTGDGQLSAIQLLRLLAERKEPLSELAGIMEVYPQILLNVKATPAQKALLESDKDLKALVRHEESRLGTFGRVLLRPSGTEPLIRVMVEGRDEALIAEIAQTIAHAVENAGREALLV